MLLRPAYLSQTLDRPLPTKDGGTLRTAAEARAYMLGAAFDPEDITAMIAAHEMALKRLGVTDRKSAMAFLVAKTVIQIATGGERDPKLLCERVIQALQSHPW
jgi:hypothetical protein